MAQYSIIALLNLSLLTFASAQVNELPLAFSETYEYLNQEGEKAKKTTLMDLTGDEAVEITIWTTETITDGLKRTQDSGIIDGDTLMEITRQQFDAFGNLILEVDSSNNRLTRRIEYNYEDSLKVSSNEFNNSDANWDPTTSKQYYFYKDGILVKTVEKQKGANLRGLLSDKEERTYSNLFEYENELLIKDISLAENDTLCVTVNTYDSHANIIKAESENLTGDVGLYSWEYDNQGNVTVEFTQYANLTQRIEYSYDSLNRLTEKLTYLRQK